MENRVDSKNMVKMSSEKNGQMENKGREEE